MAGTYLRLENEDGSFREYKKEKIKARWIKEGLKHAKKLDELERKGDIEKVLDEKIRFVCGFFGDKELTPEAVLDGLESDELFETLDKVYSDIMGFKEKEKTDQGKQ